MKKGMMVLALFLTAALPVLAKTTVKTETKSFEASGLKSVSLDVPVERLADEAVRLGFALRRLKADVPDADFHGHA
ncbi:MAG: hypothetical protein P8Z49_12190, partial [Acidobacteriota bacterium]